MIKITTTGHPEARTLLLEGRLSGSSVAELERHCVGLRPCCQPLELDLSGLVYADELGALALGLLELRGVRLKGAKGLVHELLSRNAPRSESAEGESRSAERQRADRELLKRLQAQEDTAFEELVQSYCGRMLETARHLLDDEARAARAVQAAFRHAFEGLRCLDASTDLAHFLRLEALRTTVEEFRRGTGGRASGEDDRPPPGEEVHGMRVLRLIRRLPPKQCLLLWLCDGEGVQPKTAGELLGLAATTAKAELHQARLALCSDLRRASV